mmetsp:Transcript_12340/g.45686  ORF Transcript_12340/g.45686 Transcript_12340/m.45686 type:complete len:219 (-) Transcript_12340:250-906(-)
MAEKAAHHVLYKVVLVGDPGVGKTNLLGFFTSEDHSIGEDGTANAFRETRKPTVGVEFATKIIKADDGTVIKAQIWDTAGQERYRAITSSHYRRAAGALLCYDVTNAQTLDHAKNVWFDELKRKAEKDSSLVSCTVLVGNKVDLEQQEVSEEDHEAAVSAMGLSTDFRTSARTGENVVAAFETLIRRVHDANKYKSTGPMGSTALQSQDAPRSDTACC